MTRGETDVWGTVWRVRAWGGRYVSRRERGSRRGAAARGDWTSAIRAAALCLAITSPPPPPEYADQPQPATHPHPPRAPTRTALWCHPRARCCCCRRPAPNQQLRQLAGGPCHAPAPAPEASVRLLRLRHSSEMAEADPVSLFVELSAAISGLNARGLFHSAKWAAELLTGLPPAAFESGAKLAAEAAAAATAPEHPRLVAGRAFFQLKVRAERERRRPRGRRRVLPHAQLCAGRRPPAPMQQAQLLALSTTSSALPLPLPRRPPGVQPRGARARGRGVARGRLPALLLTLPGRREAERVREQGRGLWWQCCAAQGTRVSVAARRLQRQRSRAHRQGVLPQQQHCHCSTCSTASPLCTLRAHSRAAPPARPPLRAAREERVELSGPLGSASTANPALDLVGCELDAAAAAGLGDGYTTFLSALVALDR